MMQENKREIFEVELFGSDDIEEAKNNIGYTAQEIERLMLKIWDEVDEGGKDALKKMSEIHGLLCEANFRLILLAESFGQYQ